MWGGKEFHILGAEVRRAREPNERLWRGTESKWLADERVDLVGLWYCKNSARYKSHYNSALRYLYSDDVMHRIPLIIYKLPGCCGQTHVNKMASNDGQGEINIVRRRSAWCQVTVRHPQWPFDSSVETLVAMPRAENNSGCVGRLCGKHGDGGPKAEGYAGYTPPCNPWSDTVVEENSKFSVCL